MKKATFYDVVWFVNSQAKETPLTNSSLPLCRFFAKKNEQKYKGGKLVMIDTNENKYK